VPHPAAPLRTGAPLDGPVELSIGASNFGDLSAPRRTDPDAAVEVPSTQIRAELRAKLGNNGELAAIHEQAIESTITPLDPTQAPVEHDAPTSNGLALRYAMPLDGVPGLTLGVGIEMLSWSIPYVEYRSCVDNCAGAPVQQVTRATDSIGVVAFSIAPAYRFGNWTIFGGFYAAPHPTIVRKGTELSATDYDSDISAGDYNYVFSAGAEYRYGALSLLAHIQDDLIAAPVAYAPSFGVAIAAHVLP
jgi:hypothetical protein